MTPLQSKIRRTLIQHPDLTCREISNLLCCDYSYVRQIKGALITEGLLPEKLSKIQIVRREYGEPFKKVVMDYATLKYSMSYTATVLGINPRWFYELCARFDLKKYFPARKDMNESCKSSGAGGNNRKYDSDYLLWLVKQYPTPKKFKRSAPVSAQTVYDRFKMSWPEMVAMANQREAIL
jgi:hypothetical protein